MQSENQSTSLGSTAAATEGNAATPDKIHRAPKVLLLPVYMLFLGLLGVGVGWIAASLHVYLRDTGQVLAVVMTVWFWSTPIMISEELIPARFHALLHQGMVSFLYGLNTGCAKLGV